MESDSDYEDLIWSLLTASRRGDIFLVQTLLKENQLNVNSASSDGYTPLFCALLKQHFELASYLVSQGATLDLNSSRISPFELGLHSNQDPQVFAICFQAHIQNLTQKKEHKSKACALFSEQLQQLEPDIKEDSANSPSIEQEVASCSVCLEDKSLHQLSGCKHKFCSQCLTEWCSTNQESFLIKCPDRTCSKSICRDDVLLFLGSNKQSLGKWIERVQEAVVRSDPEFHSCQICTASFSVTQEDEACARDVKCPECKTGQCLHCEGRGHPDEECFNYWEKIWLNRDLFKKKLEFRKFEEKSENWKRTEGRKCVGCYSPVQKNGGCNHMNCVRCKTEYCWNCGSLYTRESGSLKHQEPSCTASQWWLR